MKRIFVHHFKLNLMALYLYGIDQLSSSKSCLLKKISQLTVALSMLISTAAIAAPETLTQSVTHEGETITMQLTKENLRGENFELWSQNAAGTYDIIDVVPERSYVGTVDEYPGAISCGILQDNGIFRGAVYFKRGGSWFTSGNSVNSTRGMDAETWTGYNVSSSPTVTAGQAGSTMYAYELAVDVDYNYFGSAGSNNSTAFESIEYSVALVRATYMRDALLRPYLGRVIIRATLEHDPYTGQSQGGYLSALKTEWENNQSDTNPDLVAGASPAKIGGGLAWVGTVGTASGYSVSQSGGTGDFNVVFRHEMGHNWGCGHYVGGNPEGTGIMGGNKVGRFTGAELNRIFNHRDSRIALGGILDPEGTYTKVELPPYASMDLIKLKQVEMLQTSIDVLANDFDVNGQAISLQDFDKVSAQGATITQQGQLLTYKPTGSFTGTDYFTYTIVDTTGKIAEGVAIVDVLPSDNLLCLHLKLDETSGTVATDNSAYGNNGSLSFMNFADNSVPGKFETGLQIKGLRNFVHVGGVNLNSNTTTITGWIKQGAGSAQNDYAGIVLDTTSGNSGLISGTNGELRYRWKGNNAEWHSGLTPPANTWTFVALVIEPTQATILMNSGNGFESATHISNHEPAAFGSTYIAWDSSDFLRWFNGSVDDIRIYGASLTQAQLQTVFYGSSVSNPTPFNRAWDANPDQLSWSTASTSSQYHVYLGTDKTSVENATKSSPEYLGTARENSYPAPPLDVLSTYYWRVDTESFNGIVTGDVWSFTRNAKPKINIVNGHFDDEPAGAGAPGGWSLTAGTSLGVAESVSPRSQYLFMGPGTTITQDLNYNLVAGETITLQYESERNYTRNIQLLAKNGESYQLLAESTETIGDTSWPTITLNYTVANEFSAQQLSIRIISPTAWNQFDNFRISSSGAPLPNHTVIFDVDNKGTSSDALTKLVPHGSRVDAPQVSGMPGFVFDHWAQDFSIITSNQTITAVYKTDTDQDGIADDEDRFPNDPRPYYQVTLSVDGGNGSINGDIEQDGTHTIYVLDGDSASFTLTPDQEYKINSHSIGAFTQLDDVITLANITSEINQTIKFRSIWTTLNCGFEVADHFDSNKDGSGAELGNDVPYMSETESIVDSNGNVWTSSGDLKNWGSRNNYVTNGACAEFNLATVGSFWQVDIAGLNKRAMRFSFDARRGTSGSTDMDVKAWNTETSQWDLVGTINAFNAETTQNFAYDIVEATKYSKFRVQVTAVSNSRVHFDEVKLEQIALPTYTVTFNLDGKATSSDALVQTITHGENATAPVLSVDSDWTFSGWDKVFENVTENLNITAIFEAVLTPVLDMVVVQENGVLTWSTAKEMGLSSYRIEFLQKGKWQELTTISADGSSQYQIEIDPALHYRIVAIDETGFEQTFNPVLENVITVTQNLNKGWNLLSMPVENAEIQHLGKIWLWDGKKYMQDSPKPLQGFWLYAETAGEISFSGQAVNNSTVELETGWNLFGPAENIIAPTGLDIFNYEQNYRQILNDFDMLIQGRGYWFHSDEAQLLDLK